MVNRTHDSMTKAYDRVLMALTYICGPMVNDWVNIQENNLVTCTNTTKPNHVRKDDEVLWAEFETAFHDAWTVTLRPGVRLDVRFLGVASVPGSLLLPPATQMCGKRVF